MSAFSVESAAALEGPRWLVTARRAAAERAQGADLPSSAAEEWRYSRIDELDLDRYEPVLGRAEPVQVGDIVPALVAPLGSGVTLIETHQGYVGGIRHADRAVTIERMSAPDASPAPLGELAEEPDTLATLNRAFAPDPLLITVPPGVTAAPIVVIHWCSRPDAALFPRVLVQVGESAEAQVMEVVAGPARCLVAPVTELDVAPGARLGYLQVQALGEEGWQVGLQASRVGQDASLVSAAVALGGDYARLRTDSALVGPGATSRLLAVYFGAGSQMHDFRTVQHHRAMKTTSDLLYKGVVANRARSVYSGLIRVEKGARGTNAFQTNRNLVLHEGAHADSVPNLEIEDNDVRCSHASAVGPVAEDQRFYLESRGVPPEVTDRLIALGFVGEVIERLPFPALGPELRAALAGKLAWAEATERDLAAAGVES